MQGITTRTKDKEIKMMILDKPEDIKLFRLASLRSALKLEAVGMKRRGASVYSIVKKELGFKGSKKEVLKQLENHINGICKKKN